MIGTMAVADLLAARFQYLGDDFNATVKVYGEQAVGEIAAEMLAEHNAMMMDVVGDWAHWLNVPITMYGTADYTEMMETDEFGTSPPQKAQFGSVVGFPLKKYNGKWQGTRDYIARATVGEMLAQMVAIQDADRRNIIQRVVYAMFNPTNYTTNDPLVNQIQASGLFIPVKALLNADGAPIPPGPNGEIFNASTHTHYMFSTSFITSDMIALKENVLEHYSDADAMICIPRGLETAVRAMTPNFVALLPGMIVGPTTAAQDPGSALNTVDINNRLIGEFDGVPVWVKPWVPANYAFMGCRNHNKVCGIRTDPVSSSGGQLVLDFKDEAYPLRAEEYIREFGVGVWERTAAAVMMCNTNGGVYAAPAAGVVLY